jgi:PAS domain S-box-containing protein
VTDESMSWAMEHRRPPLSLFLWLLLVNITGPLFSQSFMTRTYTVSDGPASANVYAAGQDTRGLLWFATSKGITSYDGTTWTNYSRSDGLEFETYNYLLADSRGFVRAFPWNLANGFSYFFKGEWGYVVGPPGTDKKRLSITAAALLETGGKLFIGIAIKGYGLYIYTNPGWICYTADDGPGFDTVRGIVAHRNSFYLATGSGLRILSPLEPGTGTLKIIDTPTTAVYSVAMSPVNRDIWLTGPGWAGVFKDESFQPVYKGKMTGFRTGGDNEWIITEADHFGGLWIGNKITLLHLEAGGRLENFVLQNDLPVGGVHCFFYDRELNFWIGSFRGIDKIVNFSFANYRENHGLYDNEVTAIAEFDDGEIVLGHNGGFSFLTGTEIKTIGIPGANKATPIYCRVLDLRKDRAGNIWGAVTRTGIVKIEPAAHVSASHRMTWFRKRGGKGLGPDYTTVLPDGSGNVWAAANLELLKLADSEFIPVKTGIKIDSMIRRLFKGEDGAIYITTFASGVYRFYRGELAPIRCTQNGKCDSTYALLTDRRGITWVGTDAGLYTLDHDNQTLKPFLTGDTLLRNPVYFITEDNDDNLWFGLDNGVIRWNWKKKDMRHFTPRNGLAGYETNRAAGFVDSRGHMWIGTVQGVSQYNKKRDIEKTVPPLLELLYMDASGYRYPLDRPVHLDYHRNDLTIYFRGISFSDENALKYRVKLEGYDTAWISNFKSDNNQIRYTNISPGHYTFHIQAVNSSNIRSAVVSSREITIANPFWGTWWFYLITFPVLVLFLSAFERYISKKRYAARLEIQVKQRTEQLEVSKNEFRNIFEHAHDAIIIFSPEDEIVLDINQRACEIYGIPREEFIGLSLQSISKDVESGKAKVREVLEHNHFVNVETVQYQKDGSEMLLEVNASLINFRGQTAILTINRDITERRNAEERIKASLNEKVILLKEIHHRVKNNLQIILSLLDLQAETLDDPATLRVFQDTKDRIRSMALLHENLYQGEDLGRIDISEYVRKLVDYFWGLYGGMGVTINSELRVENTTLGIDTALPVGLILTELFSNSLKYAFPGGGAGTIEVCLQKDHQGMLLLCFKDNGVGLPEDVDFFNPRSLGLQLVNLLAEQLNGSVEFDGSMGISYTLRFPYKPSNEYNDNAQSPSVQLRGTQKESTHG